MNKVFIQRFREKFRNAIRDDVREDPRDFMKKSVRGKIIGVSERFVDDYTEIQLKYEIKIMGFPEHSVSGTLTNKSD